MLIRTKYGVDADGDNAAAISADVAFLGEVKEWLQVDLAADDSLIASLISAAFAYLDGNTGMLNRTLLYSEWNYVIDCFPVGAITVPLPPSASVVSLTYRDSAGTTQTLVEDTDFRVNRLGAQNYRAQLVALNGWPTADIGGDAVKVVYMAGYAQTPTALPENIKLVIKTIVAEWYENRTPRGEMPNSPAFEGLLHNARFMEI